MKVPVSLHLCQHLLLSVFPIVTNSFQPSRIEEVSAFTSDSLRFDLLDKQQLQDKELFPGVLAGYFCPDESYHVTCQ